MKKYFPWCLMAAWLVSLSAGFGVLWDYDDTPGRTATVPAQWPGQSKIPRAPWATLSVSRPTLIMFAHPQCPCTRASIGELAVLMTHCQNQVNAFVVFLRPKNAPADWLDTDLWRSAEAIPGVVVRADDEGQEAKCFQATTSGQVVLYDVAGKLQFSGGITSSRGHAGDNDGRDAIMELVHQEKAACASTPVFGCSLSDPAPGCNPKEIVSKR